MRQLPQHLALPLTEGTPFEAESMGKRVGKDDEFLTRALLRARWKCSDSTIKRREKVGLKATHLGGHTVRYRMADVLAFEQGS